MSVIENLPAATSSLAVSATDALVPPERREELRDRLQRNPPADIPTEEIEAHFLTMPLHYWDSLTEPDLRWGIATVHGFFEMIAKPNTPATVPFLNWQLAPKSNTARVMLCTWDRRGLLAKATAAFTAFKLNVQQAAVFTRSDDVVLDVFEVSAAKGRTAITSQQIEEVNFLLAGALSEPPRFASLWACSHHKYLAELGRGQPSVTFDIDVALKSTVLRVKAPDRLGLLYDLLQTLSELGLNIRSADIQTDRDMAYDTFHVVDANGNKVIDRKMLESICSRVEASLT